MIRVLTGKRLFVGGARSGAIVQQPRFADLEVDPGFKLNRLASVQARLADPTAHPGEKRRVKGSSHVRQGAVGGIQAGQGRAQAPATLPVNFAIISAIIIRIAPRLGQDETA